MTLTTRKNITMQYTAAQICSAAAAIRRQAQALADLDSFRNGKQHMIRVTAPDGKSVSIDVTWEQIAAIVEPHYMSKAGQEGEYLETIYPIGG